LQQLQYEIGNELVTSAATRRILGQKYDLFALPDAQQLAKEILSAARS
jgi:hypothetical protein